MLRTRLFRPSIPGRFRQGCRGRPEKSKLDGDKLVFAVQTLEGDLNGADGAASMFIDIIGHPFTPLSFAGVARRTAYRGAMYAGAAAVGAAAIGPPTLVPIAAIIPILLVIECVSRWAASMAHARSASALCVGLVEQVQCLYLPPSSSASPPRSASVELTAHSMRPPAEVAQLCARSSCAF